MAGNSQSELEHLYRIEKFLESMEDMDRLLSVIISEATAAVGAESCSLALYDEGAGQLYFYVAMGRGGEGEVERKLKRIRIEKGKGIIGWCAEHREVVNIENAYGDPRFLASVDKETGFRTRSILAVPMVRREKLVGVVEAVNKRDAARFTERDEKVLAILAAQAALVIENARLYEENLRRARLSALGQGIAGSAHCIKNILNGVDGGAYILESGLKREQLEIVRKGWDIMRRNMQVMRDLVLDMLSYARPKQLQLQLSDLNGICRQVADLMEQKAAERNTVVRLDLDDDLGPMVLDPQGIYRCILNLVSNAIDAVDKPTGLVQIRTRRTGERHVEVSVSDNGCGIEEKDLHSVFQPFFSTKGVRGTGLGLAITQKIVVEHGGRITVESEKGVGTTFRILLPTDLKEPEQTGIPVR